MKKLFITFSLFLLSSLAFGQLNENFESGTIPSNWAIFNKGGASPQYLLWKIINDSGWACNGNYAVEMYPSPGNIGTTNTAENWMVTNAVTVPQNGELKFNSKALVAGNNQAKFQVRVSTSSQTNTETFTILQEWEDNHFDGLNGRCIAKTINLSPYAGQQVYIAFVTVVTRSTRDTWIVDDIRLVEKCDTPTFLAVVSNAITGSSLSWNNSDNATQWEVIIKNEGDINPPTYEDRGVVVLSKPYQASNLLPNSHYKFYVRSICGLNNSSEWSESKYFVTACPRATNVSYTISGNNAIVSWDAGSASQWEVEIALQGQNFTDVGTIVNTNSHTFNNIDPKKSYKVQVKSRCLYKGVYYPSNFWVEAECIAGSVDIRLKNIPEGVGPKDLCSNEEVVFNFAGTGNTNPILSYYGRIFDSNNNVLSTFNVPETSYVFPEAGNYYYLMEIATRDCNYVLRSDFEVKECEKPKCRNGKIFNTTSLCTGVDNYFWYVPDTFSPINYNDPSLNFIWSVTDSNGNGVSLEPIYLFGNTVATYIKVPFSEGGGNYTVKLTIETKECKESFQKNVKVEKKCRCELKSNIKFSEKGICAGKEFDINFAQSDPGFTYDWNILNSNYQSVYSTSGTDPTINVTINQTGEFVVLVTVTYSKGCQALFIQNFKVENCGDKCILGDINNNVNLCAGGNNFFWFVPDVSTPIDFTDPNLVMEWYVSDPNGSMVSFEPVNLFGSNLAYYIQVPFSMGGDYVIDLLIADSKCKERFKKTVKVAKECKCHIKGKIEMKGDKRCSGEQIAFNFNDPQPGYLYNWNILNSNYQSINTFSGIESGITTVFNQEGIYAVLLTITDPNGCESFQIINIKVENCGGTGGDCYTHLAFSFAVGDVNLNNGIRRLGLGMAVTDFVNQNLNKKLVVTSIDTYLNGTGRLAAKQNLLTTQWNTPVIDQGTGDINVFDSADASPKLRIQSKKNNNDLVSLINAVASSTEINVPVDINFIIVSEDTSTSSIISSYNNMSNSGKVKKTFFIFFPSGKLILNGVALDHKSYVSQIIGSNAVSFGETNNISNSNFLVVPPQVYQDSPRFRAYFATFFKNAYAEIKKNTVCDENCLKGEIRNQDSLCAGASNAFWFNPTGVIDYTDPQLNFSWLVSQNGNSVPFEIVNGNNSAINLSNTSAGNYTITLVVSNSHCTKTYVKNVVIGTCSVPSCGDATNQFLVIKMFRDLLEHLKNQPSGTITNGYVCAELMSLQAYINPSITNPAIYNFSKSNNTLSFSFSPNAPSSHVVFKLPTNANSLNWLTLSNYVSMNNQTSFSSLFLTFAPFFPSSQLVSGSTVSQINFCPGELNCVNHIAIVLDESTSITSVDAGRIRGQLKKFVEQQVIFNQTHGSQLRLTLIGLSDQDNDARTDQITNMLVNPANKQTLINWINKYKTRYSQNLSGINSNSDYWNSGLYKAAQTNASLVLLITDGAQTEKLATLKTTIGLFNNSGNASLSRHLHVVGLSEGYYVNGEVGSSRYANSFNPNFTADVLDEDSEMEMSSNFDASITARLTDNLKISLRYLIYGNLQFPEIATVENPFSKDYSAHANFKFLYDDPYYLSNGIYDFFGRACGIRQYLEKCEECDGVQLQTGKSYIVSGWVHVDQKLQVPSFRDVDSPSIEIVFSDQDGIAIDDFYDNETGITYKSKYEFFPQGNIIDGWQRIFGVFDVHPTTFYMEIILNNASEKNAVHFDDIRIHPRNGSMKSFIYDDQNYKLMSELDENNYSTYYEYDAEGGLVRIKKETERGIKTIQETRSGSVVKPE